MNLLVGQGLGLKGACSELWAGKF